jgi:hypothetical protein
VYEAWHSQRWDELIAQGMDISAANKQANRSALAKSTNLLEVQFLWSLTVTPFLLRQRTHNGHHSGYR